MRDILHTRMEFLKRVKPRRSTVSDIVYLTLNIGLAIAVTAIVYTTNSFFLAAALVLLSKWRVFAVRPRYWWVNVQSNLVDVILNLSVVVHLVTINSTIAHEPHRVALMAILTLAYIVWLILIKPRSSRRYVTTQGLVTAFFATAAIFSTLYASPVVVTVLLMWLVGYTTARHILGSYDDETHTMVLSLAVGLVYAELAWVAYHWTVAYALPIVPSLQVPQIAIIIGLVSFLGVKVYDSFYHHARIRGNDIILPLLLTMSVIVLLLLLFNRGDATL